MSRRALPTVPIWGTFNENAFNRGRSGIVLFEPTVLTAAAIIVVVSSLTDTRTWRYTVMGTYLGTQLCLFFNNSPLQYGIFLVIVAFVGIATDYAFLVCVLTAVAWTLSIILLSKNILIHH